MYLHAVMLEKMHIKKTVGEENSDCVSVGVPDERWVALVHRVEEDSTGEFGSSRVLPSLRGIIWLLVWSLAVTAGLAKCGAEGAWHIQDNIPSHIILIRQFCLKQWSAIT